MLDFVKEETLVVCLLGQGLAPVSDSRDDEWDSVICPVWGGGLALTAGYSLASNDALARSRSVV